MTPFAAVLAIAGALVIGAISPGPSFVVVARTAVSRSRRDGLMAAAGMGLGGVAFAGLALAGLYALLTSVEWLYIGLKIAGGLYLVYLGVKIFRGAKAPLVVGGSGGAGDGAGAGAWRPRRGGSFWLGLSTQLSNPKTAIVYGSIFAALLPDHPPLWCYVVIPPLVFTIEAGWYSVVAVGFSSRRPRALYVRAKKWIDRIAAGAIAALGLRLVLTAPQSGV